MAATFYQRVSMALGSGLIALLVACGPSGGGAPSPAATARPPATPTAAAQAFRQLAETRELPRASQGLATLVRNQPWFQEMSQSRLNLVATLVKCEQAAKAKGELKSVSDMLQFASEQGWYTDGLDDSEATGLAGVLDAYARSFTKDYAPAVGPLLSSTLRYQLFRVVTLPETGDKVVVVASKDEKLGRKALDIAVEAMPRIEGLIGKFPYPFLYFEVTKDLPEYILGVSYDEFIGIGSDSVDRETIIHEITHSTSYGLFPLWFEEGLAHFVENYLTNQLTVQANYYSAEMRRLRIDERLDVRAPLLSEDDEIIERFQGFLFLKALFDIEGIEGMSKTIKALRTRSYNDQELLAAIMQQAPESLRAQVQKLFCDRVRGTTRNYCVPGG